MPGWAAHPGLSGWALFGYGDRVELWQCALWGLFGGAAVEGLEWAAAMRRGRWPWNKKVKAGPLLVSVVIRLGVGSGLAAAVGASGPISVLSAVSVGVAAPLIIEKVAQQIPIGVAEMAAQETTTPSGVLYTQRSAPRKTVSRRKPRESTTSGGGPDAT